MTTNNALDLGLSGSTGTGSFVGSASPTITGTLTFPSPFTLGATSVTSTGTQLNLLSGVTIGASGNIISSNGTTMVSSVPSSVGTVQLIATGNASNSASIAFNNLSSTYAYYYIALSNVQPVTNTASLNFTVSTDNGSTYAATSYYYSMTTRTAAGTAGGFQGSNAASFALTSSQSNAGTDCASGLFYIFNPAQSSFGHHFTYQGVWVDSTGAVVIANGGLDWNSATAINAVKFTFSAGNINTGVFKLYGVLA